MTTTECGFKLARAAVLLAVSIAVPTSAVARGSAVSWASSSTIERLFNEAGVTGTFVSCRTPGGVVTGVDAERAMQRFPPASTFKIPHTLIALEAGVVEGTQEMFEWDGAPRLVSSWQRDMTLAEAMKASNLHVYQEIARRIGPERMREWVGGLGYGNGESGAKLDRFWLEGPLEISAVEQCRFLLRLAAGQTPVSAETLAVLRDMLEEDRGRGIRLYAKTGWAGFPGPGIGWWVGWAEGPFGMAAFALNIDMPDSSYAPRRIELGRQALHALGFLVEESATPP